MNDIFIVLLSGLAGFVFIALPFVYAIDPGARRAFKNFLNPPVDICSFIVRSRKRKLIPIKLPIKLERNVDRWRNN